jgi:hypothetical protein
VKYYYNRSNGRRCIAERTVPPQSPKQPPTLAEAVLWIAKLGGCLNRKNDHPPGTTVLWRGFLALHESTEMFRIFQKYQ